MCWENIPEMSTDDGHKVYFSGKEDRHEYGVVCLAHKNMVNAILECRPVSSRLILIRLIVTPYNIAILRFMHQHPDMLTMRSPVSTSNSKKL